MLCPFVHPSVRRSVRPSICHTNAKNWSKWQNFAEIALDIIPLINFMRRQSVGPSIPHFLRIKDAPSSDRTFSLKSTLRPKGWSPNTDLVAFLDLCYFIIGNSPLLSQRAIDYVVRDSQRLSKHRCRFSLSLSL